MARPPDAHGPAATPGRLPETEPSSAGERRRGGGPLERLRAVWVSLPRERRLAAIAAFGLIFTLFLPWYQETVIAQGTTNLSSVSASLTGWGAFSFVEAAVLLVAAAVIVLLFMRAEGAAFHVPGGDGGAITAAGLWTCLLIVWRMFDKEGTTGHRLYDTASGIEWGIFIALGVAALLTYAGSRIKLAHEPEPPLPGERRPSRPRPSRRAPAAEEVAPDGRRRMAAPGDPPDAPAAGRRVRPSSLAQPRPARPPRPPAPGREDAQTQLFSETPEAGRRPGAGGARPSRGLDFRELEQIELDEPPEAPTVQRRTPAPEDPLTTRLDRPD